jgi:hypothetical protein
LGKADATVGQEVRRLDATDGAFHQATKLLTLVVGDGGAQILNLDEALADEHDLGDLCDTSYPGVASQLGIQGERSVRLVRISARGRFPLQQAARPIEFPEQGQKVV